MLIRILLLLSCLATCGWFVLKEQQAGRLQRVDDLFLDFLVANARQRFANPDPRAGHDVAFVRLREESAKDYAAWPPPPLDWRTILTSLKPFEPSVIVIASPLAWGRPAPDFIPALADALRPFPSVVLGVEAKMADRDSDAPAFMGDLKDSIPSFQSVDGDVSLALKLGSLITAPDPALRDQGELGLLSMRQSQDRWLLPYAVREGDTLAPSILAQALARATRSPYAAQRIRLGAGGGAYLENGVFIPLEPSGEMAVDRKFPVPTVDALNLMTGALADGTSDEDKAALGRGKIIVLGFDSDAPGTTSAYARPYARALAQALALPRLRKLSLAQQWAVWGAASLAGLWLVLRVRRGRAIITGIGLVFLALALSFVSFQSGLLWCPPTLPVALLLTGALAASVFGAKGHSKEAPLATSP